MAYTPILTKDEVVALLGRPLTKVEDTNFNTYLEITEIKLLGLLCRTKWPDEMTADLKELIAKAFGVYQATQKFEAEKNITNKKVEDVSITYASSSERQNPLTVVLTDEAATVAKYSQCTGGIRHGRTIYDDRFHRL